MRAHLLTGKTISLINIRAVRIAGRRTQFLTPYSHDLERGGYNKFNLNKFSEISSETGNLEIR